MLTNQRGQSIRTTRGGHDEVSRPQRRLSQRESEAAGRPGDEPDPLRHDDVPLTTNWLVVLARSSWLQLWS
jgi:hypothetical protein